MAGVTINVHNEAGNPIDRVRIERADAAAGEGLLSTTNSDGQAILDIDYGEMMDLRIIKENFFPEVRSIDDFTIDVELVERLTVTVVDEAAEPEPNVTIRPRDSRNVDILAPEDYPETDVNGSYTFPMRIDAIGTLELSKGGFITKVVELNYQKRVSVILLLENASNIERDRIISDYEEISGLVTGNSADNESVQQRCLIEQLPPIDEKISMRVRNEN